MGTLTFLTDLVIETLAKTVPTTGATEQIGLVAALRQKRREPGGGLRPLVPFVITAEVTMEPTFRVQSPVTLVFSKSFKVDENFEVVWHNLCYVFVRLLLRLRKKP